MAETNVFTTTTKGGAQVSFKIKTNKKGVAVKVVAIKITDMRVECLGDRIVPDGKLSASLRDTTVKKRTNNSGVPFYSFNVQQTIGDKKWGITADGGQEGPKAEGGCRRRGLQEGRGQLRLAGRTARA